MDLPDHFSSFRDLDRFHNFIEKQFALHQSALMDADYLKAARLLEMILKLMQKHVADEESLLLPLYEKHVNPLPSGGKPEFYIREHEQLLGYLRVFVQKTKLWTDDHQPEGLELVRLFDMYYKFKHLMDHHDTREDTFLYRLLDVKIAAVDREKVLVEFARYPELAED